MYVRARVYLIVSEKEESQISALELFRPANLTLNTNPNIINPNPTTLC